MDEDDREEELKERNADCHKMLIAIKWQCRNSEVQDVWDKDGNTDGTKEKLTECNSDVCQDDHDKD